MYSTFSPRNRQIAEKLSRKLEQPLFTSINDVPQPKTKDQRFRLFREKLVRMSMRNKNEQQQLQAFIMNIQETLYKVDRSKNQSQELLMNLSQGFDAYAQNQYNSRCQKLAHVRKQMTQDLQTKKKTMKVDVMDAIDQQFQQTFKSNLSEIQKQMKALVNSLEQQRILKQQSASELAENIGSEIIKMEQFLASQKQTRRNQNRKMIDLIGQMEDSIQHQINQEIKNREKSQSYIQTKLQELCRRIQNKILGSY